MSRMRRPESLLPRKVGTGKRDLDALSLLHPIPPLADFRASESLLGFSAASPFTPAPEFQRVLVSKMVVADFVLMRSPPPCSFLFCGPSPIFSPSIRTPSEPPITAARASFLLPSRGSRADASSHYSSLFKVFLSAAYNSFLEIALSVRRPPSDPPKRTDAMLRIFFYFLFRR